MLVLTASIVVLALLLVAPVDGQSVSSEHRFQLVHPIFPHVHLAGAGHHDLGQDDADVTMPAGGPNVTILPAGPFGPGPLVTSEGIHVPTVSALAGLWLILGLVQQNRRLADQTWLAVPTGPPR